MDEAGHLNSMEVECDTDAEISETLDEVELDDTCAGASNLEESLDVLTTGGTGRIAAVGCGSGKSALGDGVTESGVGNVGRGRRPVGTVSQKDVNDCIQVAASETPVGEGMVGKHTVNSVQNGDQPRVTAEGTDKQDVQLHRSQPFEQVQEGAIGCVAHVDGSKQGFTVSSSHHALPGDEGSKTAPGDGVAYLVEGQIKAVGKVDHDRTTAHGRKIGKGFALVQLYYVQSGTQWHHLFWEIEMKTLSSKQECSLLCPSPSFSPLGSWCGGKKLSSTGIANTALTPVSRNPLASPVTDLEVCFTNIIINC